MSWKSSLINQFGELQIEELSAKTLEEISSLTSDFVLPSKINFDDELELILLIANLKRTVNQYDLYNQTIKMLQVPSMNWIWWEDDYTRTKPEYAKQNEFRSRAKNALVFLDQLLQYIVPNKEFFTTLSCYALPTPWSNFFTVKLSTTLLSKIEIKEDDIYRLIRLIHDDFKTIPKNEKITSAGYKKSYHTPNFKSGISIASQNSRLNWKENHIKSVSSLYTLISKLDSKGIRDNWWVISPSILNILDDHEGPIKLAGVNIVSKLLEVVEPEIFTRTGLDKILSESIYPLTTYLPQMTPTDLSKAILTGTYPALMKLLSLRDSSGYEKGLLDLLNNAIFFTLNSVRDNFIILQVLLDQMINIIDELKLKTLKTLPRLIYHLGTIISSPFIDLHPGMFFKSLECLVHLELNCWPALKRHRIDILGMIVMSYKREKKTDDISQKIRLSLLLLERVIGRENLLSDYEELVKRDATLSGLFQI